jgi:hypothetical protein
MNFELTDEQKDIKRAAREFAEKTFPEVPGTPREDVNDFLSHLL